MKTRKKLIQDIKSTAMLGGGNEKLGEIVGKINVFEKSLVDEFQDHRFEFLITCTDNKDNETVSRFFAAEKDILRLSVIVPKLNQLAAANCIDDRYKNFLSEFSWFIPVKDSLLQEVTRVEVHINNVSELDGFEYAQQKAKDLKTLLDSLDKNLFYKEKED